MAGAAPIKFPLERHRAVGASHPPSPHLLAHTRRPDCQGLRGGSGGRWTFWALLRSSAGIQGGLLPPSPSSAHGVSSPAGATWLETKAAWLETKTKDCLSNLHPHADWQSLLPS